MPLSYRALSIYYQFPDRELGDEVEGMGSAEDSVYEGRQ